MRESLLAEPGDPQRPQTRSTGCWASWRGAVHGRPRRGRWKTDQRWPACLPAPARAEPTPPTSHHSPSLYKTFCTQYITSFTSLSPYLVLPTKSEPGRHFGQPSRDFDTKAHTPGRGTRKQNNNHYQTTNLVSHVRTKSGGRQPQRQQAGVWPAQGSTAQQGCSLHPSCW